MRMRTLDLLLLLMLRTLLSKSLHDASLLWPFIASVTKNPIQTNLKISKRSDIMASELKHSNLLQ